MQHEIQSHIPHGRKKKQGWAVEGHFVGTRPVLLVGGPRFSNLQMRAGTSHDDEPGAWRGVSACPMGRSLEGRGRESRGTARQGQLDEMGSVLLCSTTVVALRCQARNAAFALLFTLPPRPALPGRPTTLDNT